MPSRRELANAIRALSMDAVQQANSGHPGAPMGMADMAQVLWSDFLQHNPSDPSWINRDRFVLSNGHASMLIYSLLHLSGYDLSIEDLKDFRQAHSKTPGHPECGDTPGVETTTGPLGQGIANAVGMALAERTLAATFNKDNFPVIDHYTYTFLGDGCLMEGVSHEVCAFAGTLGLGKLIAFWDDNGISIDGKVADWFSDDTPARFEAYGWQVIRDIDGHDGEAIASAVHRAQAETGKPTLICCKTVIGFGAPTVGGTSKCHGAPLGDEEIAKVRADLNWPYAPFTIPEPIRQAWDAREVGQQRQKTWNTLFGDYQAAHPELATELKRRLAGDLPADWENMAAMLIADTDAAGASPATRKASLSALNSLVPNVPELLGGSADLTGSNLTAHAAAVPITPTEACGDYLHYGVREFGMAAIMNGIALHGGFIPFGGTFLTFLDYARNAVRMAALMKVRSIFVFTHDSVGLGEDGPTHQPVEQLASLRASPNVHSWRPCDAVETAVAWTSAIARDDGPTCLILSRQGLQHQQRTVETRDHIAKGGYILQDCEGTPDLILLATGSEVALVMEAAEALSDIAVRVVSMPCQEAFKTQSTDYQESVLPISVRARVAVEALSSASWHAFVGLDGQIVGLDTFGLSAPGNQAFELLGFTKEHVIKAAKTTLAHTQRS